MTKKKGVSFEEVPAEEPVAETPAVEPELPENPNVEPDPFEGWIEMKGAIYGKKIGQNAVLIRDVVTGCTMALEGVTIIGDVCVTK